MLCDISNRIREDENFIMLSIAKGLYLEEYDDILYIYYLTDELLLFVDTDVESGKFSIFTEKEGNIYHDSNEDAAYNALISYIKKELEG